MSNENCYERFRNQLVMNLMPVLDTDKLHEVLKAVDITMNDFEISKKSTDIIVIDPVSDKIKEFIASKAVANASKGTLKQYTYKLFNFFNVISKSYKDIQPNDIRIYLYNYKIEHNVSDRYIDNIRMTIGLFFAWLFDNEYITKNPSAKVEPIKFRKNERVPLTSYELEEIRYDCVTSREKALVDFFFSTGCRVSECADVLESDINWNERSVVIRHGKGDKRRIVYFNAESELSLRKYLETRISNDGHIFCKSRSPYTGLSSHSLEEIIKKISQRANIEVFPHKLRHTFATHGLRCGMSLERLQKLMGHEDPKTTLIYAKHNLSDLRIEHQKAYA